MSISIEYAQFIKSSGLSMKEMYSIIGQYTIYENLPWYAKRLHPCNTEINKLFNVTKVTEAKMIEMANTKFLRYKEKKTIYLTRASLLMFLKHYGSVTYKNMAMKR